MGFPKLTILERTVTTAHPIVENIIRLKKDGVTAQIVPSESYEFRTRQAIVNGIPPRCATIPFQLIDRESVRKPENG